MGLLGIVTFGCGLHVYNSKGRYHEPYLAEFLMFIAIAWCLGWSSGVVIWGGEKGATIVGIVWGAALLMVVAIVVRNIRRDARG